MRIGIFSLGEGDQSDPLVDLITRTRGVAEDGLPSAWIGHGLGVDTLVSLLAVVGDDVHRAR